MLKPISPLLLFLFTPLLFSCFQYESMEASIVELKTPKEEETEYKKPNPLLMEEVFVLDPENNSEYTPSFKKEYIRKGGKLKQILFYEYNPSLGIYHEGELAEEYTYSETGQLSKRIIHLTMDKQRVEEYHIIQNLTYSLSYTTGEGSDPKDTRKVYLEKSDTLQNTLYFDEQGNQYWKILHRINPEGNITSTERTPTFPAGKITYTYDSAPNPYYFPEIIGHPGTEKYYSKNNVLNINNTLSFKMEYNQEGYLVRREPVSSEEKNASTKTFTVFTYYKNPQ
jgi:hypothetical protein